MAIPLGNFIEAGIALFTAGFGMAVTYPIISPILSAMAPYGLTQAACYLGMYLFYFALAFSFVQKLTDHSKEVGSI